MELAGSAATSQSAARAALRALREQGLRPWRIFFRHAFEFVVRPSDLAVQVDAEAQAGAAQVDHVALVVREPEAEVSKRDLNHIITSLKSKLGVTLDLDGGSF